MNRQMTLKLFSQESSLLLGTYTSFLTLSNFFKMNMLLAISITQSETFIILTLLRQNQKKYLKPVHFHPIFLHLLQCNRLHNRHFQPIPFVISNKMISFAKANRLIRYYHQKLKRTNHGRIEIISSWNPDFRGNHHPKSAVR